MIQVIDFETTGLIDPQPVQYAQVVFSESSIATPRWEFEEVVILPTKPMEYGAMGVTGITNEFLQENYDLKYDEVKSGKGWIGEGVEYLVVRKDADYCLWLLSSGKIRSKLMADYLDGLLGGGN